MAPAAATKVEEYIARFIEGGEKPVCEFIDGTLIPKPVGSKIHSRTQLRVATLISANYPQFRAYTELHTRPRPGEFLFPDVAVERNGAPPEDYPGPNSPVDLCVGIASPGQTLGRLLAKCDDYHAWGGDYCWLIDPAQNAAWEYHRRAELNKITLEGTLQAGDIELQLSEIL